MIIKEDVAESLANFIQGRAPRAPITVGSVHYLNKVQQIVDQYRTIIGKFPI